MNINNNNFEEILFDEKKLAEKLGVSIKKLQKDRSRKEGPPFVKIGRGVRYRPSDVEKYLAKNTVRTTSAEDRFNK